MVIIITAARIMHPGLSVKQNAALLPDVCLCNITICHDMDSVMRKQVSEYISRFSDSNV